MKKALLIIVAILAVTFFMGNADMVFDFIDIVGTGATIPLIIAVIFMVLRHLTQAASYDAAFDAVGFKTGFLHNVILIFSLVFINTFCLFSGATGLAFIIDDAHRKGASLGVATGGGLLSQIGFFAAVFVIAVIGTIVMFISDSMNYVILTGFIVLAAVLFGQTACFIIGYYKPDALYWLLTRIEKIGNWILHFFKRSMRAAWGTSTADQFIDASRILAHNPMGVVITIAWASLSAILNMACLMAIGFAFDFTQIAPLVAAFALAVVTIMLSPTPQGIGVTEAAIAIVLTAAGSTATTAAAIALVYRGIMLWIPFLIGAVLLSQSGFFKSKKTAAPDQKQKDFAWITGTLLALFGAVNIALALVAPALAPYGILTQFVDLSGVLGGSSLIFGGIVLFVCAIGIIRRSRIMWAASMLTLSVLAGLELYYNTWQVAVPLIALGVALFIKRDIFTKSPFWSERAESDEKQLLEPDIAEAAQDMEDMPRTVSSIEEMSATLDDLHNRSKKMQRKK
ncbi:lysylphosphatidylglycerol synthase transmembrane domain-containing protein [Adlercreutzia sp. ZJ154]|uniref:lysylphosphatidylglycerol synthase transmembrane domain-containing protein n=1 Tax=Adlercreutzia sp. ZJ154 TaxID=2709790 RepID=UPI0013EAF4F0|nr:lysylphosphatidylglycerol synthase transmembrane domain-containing protein [Adlercreutzia sp. ZJ154]